MKPRCPAPVTALAAVLAAATVARADIDIEVGNADTVSGTISPATETEVIRFRVPSGATVTVRAKAAKKGPELHVRLRDPMGGDVLTADGKSAVIAGAAAAASGVYSVEVTSRNGVAVGDYSVSVAWKSKPVVTATVNVAANGSSTLNFSADAGATATLSAKAAKGSAAAGALVSLTAPDASVVPLTGAALKRLLPLSGDYVLSFANSAASAGDVTAAVKLKAPKPSKRKIALTAKVIDPGGSRPDFATAGMLGAAGGTVSVPVIPPGQPGSELSGTSVSVPPGALGASTTIIVATAPDLDPAGSAMGAGPTVFFGPEGTQFNKNDKTTTATITLPYDPAFDATTDTLQIFTRDAKGKVRAVPPPYTFDTTAHTVSFPTSHFSSFRAMGPDTGASVAMLTYANMGDPQDICLAFEPGSPPAPAVYFVAAGASKTVVALRLNLTGIMLTTETWAGGGTQTIDGTDRRQFLFQGRVIAVTAASDGQVWLATPTQVFHVGTDDKVDRVAGSLTPVDTGDNGPATSANFVSISSIVVDDNDGTLYVADAGAHRIRRIDPTSQSIFAWAGTGASGLGADGVALDQTTFLGPADIALANSPDRGMYVADGARVRHLAEPIISVAPFLNVTVAGSAAGATGSAGDGGPALSATFQQISSLSTFIDVADFTAVKLVVSDVADHTLRLIDVTNDNVKLVAGQHGTPGFSGDFSTVPGLLDSPRGVIALPGQITFADNNNDKVRTRFVGAGFP